jgi:hypothetical protein
MGDSFHFKVGRRIATPWCKHVAKVPTRGAKGHALALIVRGASMAHRVAVLTRQSRVAGAGRVDAFGHALAQAAFDAAERVGRSNLDEHRPELGYARADR